MSLNRRTSVAFVLALLACAGSAQANIAVDSKVTTHNDLFGWCTTRSFKVFLVTTIGHPPGTCWYTAILCGISIRRHADNLVAEANNPTGITGDTWMGFATLGPGGTVGIDLAMNSATIPQALFSDPGNILSGDVTFQSPGGFSNIIVPTTLGITHPYSMGTEATFNFDPGDGMLFSTNDEGYTGIIDGTVFQPIPSPGAVALTVLAAAMGLSRRRR